MQLMTNNNKTMSSREIAELTGKEHSNVKRDISAMVLQLNYPSKKLKDCPVFDPSELKGHNIYLKPFEYIGNYYDEFFLDQDMSLLLVSGYNVNLRLSIIKRWKELEVKQIETPEQLMARALISAQTVIQAKDQLLEEAKPAIELHESIVNDKGTLSMRDAGKQLQVKPNKFIEWLRDAKYLNYDNYAYQSKIDAGYMRLSTTEHNGKPRTNTRVTGKGFAHFGKKIAEIRFSNPDHLMFYRGKS